MKSRKAWRTRDPSANDEVLALIEVLRDSFGAEQVALFDDDRGDPLGNTGAFAFWDAFDQPRCQGMSWNAWYRSLRENGRVGSICGCEPGHRVDGFLIHGRWVLLLMGPADASAANASAVASTLRALSDKLPPCRSHAEAPLAEREREREQARERNDARTSQQLSPPASGGPLFWVRKLRE